MNILNANQLFGLNSNTGGTSFSDLTSLLYPTTNSAATSAFGDESAQSRRQSPTGTSRAPSAPWTKANKAELDALVKSALAGGKFIKDSSIKLDMKDASEDYKKLFALYQGVNTLQSMSTRAQDTKLNSSDLAALRKHFDTGVQEVSAYLQATRFDHLNLVGGTLSSSLKSDVKIAATNTVYHGNKIHTGASSEAVPGLTGDVKFTVSVKKTGRATPIDVAIDLNEMGSQTRSMSNISSFVNNKLRAAGLSSRIEVERTPGAPKTTTVNGKTTTIGKLPDTFGFKVAGDSSEALSFGAEKKADSVFVLQTTGKETTTSKFENGKNVKTTTNTFSKQMLKFQTDQGSGNIPDAPVAPLGATYGSANLSEQQKLEASIKTVRASEAAPDGGVYVLADVNATTDGQTIKGSTDVALIKYDTAGQVVFTRTLGASDNASGLALAVSADGHIGVTGSITGTFEGKDGISATTTDSFVSLYDAQGVEQWTKRRGGTGADEGTTLTFDAANNLFVGGRSKSMMPGASGVMTGGYDTYITAYDDKGVQKFTQMSGTSGNDDVQAMLMDGTMLYTASSENGVMVVKSFETVSGTAVETERRTFGGLGGGKITSLSMFDNDLYIGGSTGNGSLDTTGTVKSAYSGGMDAFALKIDASLKTSPGGGNGGGGGNGNGKGKANKPDKDVISYYGGAGNETAQVKFLDGKAYIAGQAGGAITGTSPISTKDAYLTRLDPLSGNVEWTQRYTGKDGVVDPNAIAITRDSSSVLDRLGLPQGTLLYKDSTTLASNSSVRTGDQFALRDSKSGRSQTIKIDANETLETLAAKIQRQSGFNLKVSVVKSDGNATLRIVPNSKTASMEIVRGPNGKDALESLGIKDGLVKDTVAADAALVNNPQGLKKDVGLSFDNTINLDSTEEMTRAMSTLNNVITKLRSSYTWLRFGTPQDSKGSSGAGQVPAYLTNQISNYQAALNRLTGGA